MWYWQGDGNDNRRDKAVLKSHVPEDVHGCQSDSSPDKAPPTATEADVIGSLKNLEPKRMKCNL